MTKAVYFLGKNFIGSAELPPHHIGSDSQAYFCSTCGDIWARIIIEGATYHLWNVPCENHSRTGVPDWSATPGSLLIPTAYRLDRSSCMFWAATLEILPIALLRREFHLHLRKFT